jgi:hypothetical protein
MELLSGSTLLQANDNWRRVDEVSGFPIEEINRVVSPGLLLDEGSRDSAIARLLPPGDFTVAITSADQTSGVALAEIYDVPNAAPAAGRLLNLSTRGQVGVGEDILIAGFVVRGGPARLLLRGIGPGLAQFNVPNVLQQPKMTAFRENSSVPVISNTGWTADGYIRDITIAAARVGAFPLEAQAADCAVLFDALPGGYTVQISGVGAGATTGEAMVEVYLMP